MAQTVVGFFDDASDARRAIEQLTEHGISRDSIDLRENSTTDTTSVRSDRNDDGDNGITRFFKSLFGNDDDADRYSRVASNSRCIVSVRAADSDEAERVADVLDDCGAINVDERAQQFTSASNLRNDDDTDRGNRSETVIPRMEENLKVGKRVEEHGGVRVRSRIVERPVEEHVRLREEHVNVERQAVNRPLNEGDANQFQDREIELTERTEVPVVNKEARVVEEVRLTKDVTERDETIRDTVRNTEIDVDKLSDRHTTRGNDTRTDSDDYRSDIKR